MSRKSHKDKRWIKERKREKEERRESNKKDLSVIPSLISSHRKPRLAILSPSSRSSSSCWASGRSSSLWKTSHCATHGERVWDSALPQLTRQYGIASRSSHCSHLFSSFLSFLAVSPPSEPHLHGPLQPPHPRRVPLTRPPRSGDVRLLHPYLLFSSLLFFSFLSYKHACTYTHSLSLYSRLFICIHSHSCSQNISLLFCFSSMVSVIPSPTASSSRSTLPIIHLFDSFKCGLFSLLFGLCLRFWLYNQISFWWIFLDSRLALIWVTVVQQTALSVSHFLSPHSGLTSSHSARRCGFTLSLLLHQKRTSSSLASASLLTHSALKCSKLVSRRRKSSKARFAASIYTRALARLTVRIVDN